MCGSGAKMMQAKNSGSAAFVRASSNVTFPVVAKRAMSVKNTLATVEKRV